MTVKELKNILELVEDENKLIQIEVVFDMGNYNSYEDVNISGIRRGPENVTILLAKDFKEMLEPRLVEYKEPTT